MPETVKFNNSIDQHGNGNVIELNHKTRTQNTIKKRDTKTNLKNHQDETKSIINDISRVECNGNNKDMIKTIELSDNQSERIDIDLDNVNRKLNQIHLANNELSSCKNIEQSSEFVHDIVIHQTLSNESTINNINQHKTITNTINKEIRDKSVSEDINLQNSHISTDKDNNERVKKSFIQNNITHNECDQDIETRTLCCKKRFSNTKNAHEQCTESKSVLQERCTKCQNVQEQCTDCESVQGISSNRENIQERCTKLKNVQKQCTDSENVQVNNQDEDIAMNLINSVINSNQINYYKIRVLDLSNQNINFISDSFQKLTNLAKINLSQNNLYELPDLLYLPYLKELNLSHNKFLYIPYCVLKMFNKLTILDVSHNQLKEFHKLNCKSYLFKLYLNNNHDLKLPLFFWTEDYPHLVELDISHTDSFNYKFDFIQEKKIEKNFGFTNLNKFVLKNVQASPVNVCQLKYFENLKHLICSNDKKILKDVQAHQSSSNIFWELPSPILYLKNLKILELSNVHLRILSEDISKLQSIEVLDVSKNLLSMLPESLCDLKLLKSLNVSFNKLNELPKEFGDMSRLVYCDLYSNELEESCLSVFESLQCLKKLDLMQNYISEDLIPQNLQESLRLDLPEDEQRCSSRKQPPISLDFYSPLNSCESYSSWRSESTSSRDSLDSCDEPVSSVPIVPSDDLDQSNWDDCSDEINNFGTPVYVPNQNNFYTRIDLDHAIEQFIRSSSSRHKMSDLPPSGLPRLSSERRVLPKIDVLAYIMSEHQFDSD